MGDSPVSQPATDEAPDASGGGSSHASKRIAAAAALAVTEALLLSFLFDASSISARGALGAMLGMGGKLLTLVVCVAAGLVVFGHSGHGQQLKLPRVIFRPKRDAVAVLVHLVAYAVLLITSRELFDRGAGDQSVSPIEATLWACALVATALSLAIASSDLSYWRALAREAWRPALLGLAAGGLAWLGGTASAEAWRWLSDLTLSAVATLLMVIEPEIVHPANSVLLGTPRFTVSVAPVCSGFEGLGLMGVFVSLFLYLKRHELRLARAVWLLPVSLVVVWLANALRIAALILVGTHGSPGVALGGFHSKAGWVFFCLVALGTLAVAHRIPALRRGPEASPLATGAKTYNPTLVYLAPLLVFLSAAMVTGMFADRVDYAYGLRVVAATAILAVVRRRLPRPRLRMSYVALLIGGVVYVVWVALEPSPDAAELEAAHRALAGLGSVGLASWVTLRLLGSVLVAPTVEELAFRGFLLPRLVSRDFLDVSPRQLTVISVVVSSLAFGLLHDRWLAGSLAGFAFALARSHRGRLGDAVMAHATTNLLLALDVLLRDNWHYWL